MNSELAKDEVPTTSFVTETEDPDFWIRARYSPTDFCLGYRVDTYGGIIFDSNALPEDPDSFRKAFECSLNILQTGGYNKGYWLQLPMDRIDLLPICIKEYGFYIHNARAEHVMLAKWTHPTKPNPIPTASTHQVGVGCVIMRSDRAILLVKEKSGPAAIGGGIWKLPTGLVEPIEDLPVAALREAKEETGIDCQFHAILEFRHSHGGSPALGAISDLMFVCILSPIDESQVIVTQEAEILEARWVLLSELESVTHCEVNTSAWKLMDNVRRYLTGEHKSVVVGSKHPAWRRPKCDQWIFTPDVLE